MSADKAKTFAEQAVAALADAMKAGSCEIKQLKDTDLDSLRERVDFKKLIAELDAKAKK